MDYTNEYLKEVLSLRYGGLSQQSLKRIEAIEITLRCPDCNEDMEFKVLSQYDFTQVR